MPSVDIPFRLLFAEALSSNFFRILPKTAAENIDQTQGEDLWVGSIEASVVESAKKHFLSDWRNAVPSVQKIQEIEEGRMPVKTRILENEDEITKELIRLNTSANRLSICSVFGGMQMSHKYLFDSYQKILNNGLRSEESDEGIRWITNIGSRDSLDLVRIFLDAGIKIRHIKNLSPMSFGVSDKEIAAAHYKITLFFVKLFYCTQNIVTIVIDEDCKFTTPVTISVRYVE